MSDISPLLDARYGSSSAPSPSGAVNPTLKTLLEHRSVRQFLPKPLTPGTIELLVAAGQSAATSSNLQTWSVVAVQDAERKSHVATLCGDQGFIRDASLFLVFCADLSRLTKVSDQEGTPAAGLEYTEMFLMASLDASLAAQNVSVAAESLGLGICYVGAARNKPQELASYLGLPERVVALFGMAIGWPNLEKPASVKPRLSQREIVHHEKWDDGEQREHIEAYNKTLAAFDAGQQRTAAPTWTKRSANRVATEKSLTGRHVYRQVLSDRGFTLL